MVVEERGEMMEEEEGEGEEREGETACGVKGAKQARRAACGEKITRIKWRTPKTTQNNKKNVGVVS